MRTEDEFVTKIKALLADEHDRKESSFDHLTAKMREAYAREGSILDDDLEVVINGSDDDDVTDALSEKYPLTTEIAASVEDDDDGDEDDKDDD